MCVCAFISAYRSTPSTACSKDLSWPRPARRPSTFTLTTASQVHIYLCVCVCVRVCVCVCSVCVLNAWQVRGGVIILLLIQLLHDSYTLSLSWFYVHRVPPDRRLDRSLSLHYSQEHPGGPLEPAQLYQNPGGEPAEICGWLVDRGHTHMCTYVHVMVYSYNRSLNLVFLLPLQMERTRSSWLCSSAQVE